MKRLSFCILIIVLTSSTAVSQQGHYWTQQYGTRSMLLCGSVIGGVSDLGAVYYNPARLSQVDNLAFLISADVYELNKIAVEDAFGENLNASKTDLSGVPTLAAGSLTIPFLKNHYFAWAILQRVNSSLSFGYKNEVYADVIDIFPGEEIFGAEIAFKQASSDQWTTFSWSYPLSDRLSIGASGFFSYYTQQKGYRLNLQAYTDSNQTAVYRFNREVTLQQYSLIGKIGVSYIWNNTILGLTLLTPRLDLKGKGSYNFEELFSGTDHYAGNDVYLTTSLADLRTELKSPWAVGVGITIPIKKNKLHISSEWYSAVPKYTLVEGSEYVSQSKDTLLEVRLVDEYHSIVDFGIGAEIYLSEKISGYLSACTDFSAIESEFSNFLDRKVEIKNSAVKADFYHFGGGVVLTFKGADITLGATYTGASQDFKRPVNFPENSDDDIFGDDDMATLSWDRIRFVFSFSMPFLKDVQKKVEDKFGF